MDVEQLEALGAAVAEQTGAPPFNDQALIEARRGERTIIPSEYGAALVSATEAELAIWPEHQGNGYGTELAERVAEHFAGRAWRAWAHGDHPAAARIAARLGMRRVRELLQLRAPVPQAAEMPDGIRPFAPADAEAWLALNAAAFADHPEQGSLTAVDLADRRASDWHDDANLLLTERGGELAAYTWIKPSGDVAELYAVGVSPAHQGEGLGRLMLDATFARMRELGFTTAHLYVEGENEPALRLYERGGFTRFAIDVQYAAAAVEK